MNHGLITDNTEKVEEYWMTLRRGAANDEWELIQKRTDKALEYSQEIIRKRRQSLNDARKRGGRNWILPAEYDSFMEGIEEAMKMEENKVKVGYKSGPFHQLLKYKPGTEGAGIFPPTGIWLLDLYRVLYGLTGDKGDAMRKAELMVYDGVPFAKGSTGRKKIESGVYYARQKSGKADHDADWVVANYWRDKIKEEARQTVQGKWLPLRFVFTEKELSYQNEQLNAKIKPENEDEK